VIKAKILDDGNFLYVDPITHDAVKINAKMVELKRVKGNPLPESYTASAPNFNKNRRSCFSDDGRKVLWINGMNHIAVLDTETMAASDVPNFWVCDSSWCFSMLAVADKNFSKFGGIGFNAQQALTLHIYDTQVGFKSQLAHNIVKSKKLNFLTLKN